MSIIKKSIIIAASTLIVGIGAGVAYVSYTDSQPVKSSASVTPSVTPTVTPSQKPTSTPAPTGESMISLAATHDKDADGALEAALDPNVKIVGGQDSIIGIMHHMTHQKVDASDKWTNVKMTAGRVHLIVQIIEQKGKEWKYYNELLIMANKWEAKDFSKIDEDHNFLWTIEGGNIGKAKGILSAADEKAFIEQEFNQ